jgi:serine/threonine protein kinase
MTDSSKVCPQCGSEYSSDERFCALDGSALRSRRKEDDLVGTVVDGRYLVTEVLGEGGVGRVYLAEHVRISRKVALKVLRNAFGLDVDAVARFHREAANASQILHPNVAAVYDYGETEQGSLYIAMEYVDGPTLGRLLHEHGPLAPQRVAEITRQVAQALAVAHSQGIG